MAKRVSYLLIFGAAALTLLSDSARAAIGGAADFVLGSYMIAFVEQTGFGFGCF